MYQNQTPLDTGIFCCVGGQMIALAHQISYATPSVSLFHHLLLTKRLIFFSRLVLNIEINTTNITTKQWKKRKKNDKYDTTFFNMKEKERLYYRDSIFDIQFEYQVSALFSSLMKVIIDIGHEEIHSITSFNQNGIDIFFKQIICFENFK